MISNPSTSVINELFGKSRDAAASVAASGQTSATPGTATTHALAPSVKAVLVVNAGTAAIAASVDDGTNWVAIAASGSLLVDVPLGRVQVKCDTAARVPYSISATTRAISQTVVPAAVAVLDALEKANTIYVGPGMRYTTVQAAITAAAADAANTYTIVPTPGTELKWDDPLPLNVEIDYTPKRLEPVVVPWNAPLITIMADDCLADWTTPEVELGNISPLQYAANYGVPINLGLIGKDYADTANVPANRVSMAGLNTFCRQNLALYAHTWTHADPADQQGVLQETLGVRQLIDSLHAASIGTPGAVNQYIGTRCLDYWKAAGDMKGDNLIDGLAKLHKTMARTVRKYYGASGAYYGTSSQQKPHFGAGYFTGSAAVTATASAPASNIMLFTHGLGSYAGDLTVSQFKSIIDNIVTLRAAGQAYPVTVETWFAAVMCGATGVTDTTRASVWRNLNCVAGCVDELADGAVSTTYKSNGWYSSGVGASVVDLGGGEKCLQIDNVGGATCMLNHTLALEPGRKYSLSFLARRIPLGGTGHWFRVALNTPYMSVAGVSTNNIVTLRTSTLPDADDWVRYWYTFEVPWWSTTADGMPAIWIGSPPGVATKLQVRDILLARQ